MLCTDFTIIPSSQVVGAGQQAVFRCLHLTAVAILWKVNGTVVSEHNPPRDVTTGRTLDGNRIVTGYTPTITAQLNYNETEIVCVAVFVNNSILIEETAPVNLTIQGKTDNQVNIYHATMHIIFLYRSLGHGDSSSEEFLHYHLAVSIFPESHRY